MNTREKYDETIMMIENIIEHAPCDLKSTRIVEKIVRHNATTVTNINAVFSYLMGMTLKQYIVERRLMAAYKYLLETKDDKADAVLNISGYENDSSFDKACSNRFCGMSRKDVNRNQRWDLYEEPKTWDIIGCEQSMEEIDNMLTVEKKQTILGIDADTYNRIMEAKELQELYEFDNLKAEAALKIYDRFKDDSNVSMYAAFDYVDDFVHQYCLDANNRFLYTKERFLEYLNLAEGVAYYFMTVTGNITQAEEILKVLRHLGHSGVRDANVGRTIKEKIDEKWVYVEDPRFGSLFEEYKKNKQKEEAERKARRIETQKKNIKRLTDILAEYGCLLEDTDGLKYISRTPDDEMRSICEKWNEVVAYEKEYVERYNSYHRAEPHDSIEPELCEIPIFEPLDDSDHEPEFCYLPENIEEEPYLNPIDFPGNAFVYPNSELFEPEPYIPEPFVPETTELPESIKDVSNGYTILRAHSMWKEMHPDSITISPEDEDDLPY